MYNPLCVIIGSGDGLIPRVIRESQIQSFEDDSKNGKTYLIDLGETYGAMPQQIHDKKSLFRKMYPEIIVYKGLSVCDGLNYIKKYHSNIDVLWIDGDHSHIGSLRDFDNYSKLLSEHGLIFLHDTAPTGANNIQPAWCGVHTTIEYIKKNYKHFELINFTRTSQLKLGAGLAIVKHNLWK